MVEQHILPDTDASSQAQENTDIPSDFAQLESFRGALSTYKYVSPKKKTRQLTVDDEEQYYPSKHNSGTSTQITHFDYSTPSTPRRRSSEPDDNEETTLPRIPKRNRTSSSEPSISLSSRKRPKRGYAPPETYEHLHHLQDYLEPHLDIVFCGINPGYKSAETGCHYAHSTNHFWQTLHLSGLTDRQLSPSEAHVLLEQYKFGLTNLVDRPTAEQSELSSDEMRQSVPNLMDKIAKYRPRILCFLGKRIWEVFRQQAFKLALASEFTSSSRKTRAGKGPCSTSRQLASPPVKSKYFSAESLSQASELLPTASQNKTCKTAFMCGLQPFKIVHRPQPDKPTLVHETLIFVVPSPSARVVAYQWWDKVEFFKRLHEHIPLAVKGAIDTANFTILPLTTSESV